MRETACETDARGDARGATRTILGESVSRTSFNSTLMAVPVEGMSFMNGTSPPLR